jgi:hypothetical protein
MGHPLHDSVAVAPKRDGVSYHLSPLIEHRDNRINVPVLHYCSTVFGDHPAPVSGNHSLGIC